MKSTLILFFISCSFFTYAQTNSTVDTVKTVRSFKSFWTRTQGIRISGGSDPVYVIDGKVVATEVLENTDPSIIQSISVVKDAAQVKLYTAKGGSWVVLIATKNKIEFPIKE